MVPFGLLTVMTEAALRTSSSDRPLATSLAGSICSRTAGFCSPPISTWATPWTWLMRWASLVSAASSTSVSGTAFELTARIIIGASAGLDLR